jgi:hypothetical protein
VSVLFYGRSRMREERPWAWCEVRSMSRHFFMTSAHTPWNRRHWPWPCPPPFVTSSAQPRSSRSRPIAAIEVSGNQATRRRAAGPCSPTLASPCSQTSGTRTGTPLRANMGIFHPIPFTGISVERHLSRIVPCLTRSLARCFSRARRHIGFCFCRTPPPTKGVGSPLRKKHPRHLGARHLTSLRARVSRVRTGQIQTGEKQWHSMKTRSL